MNEKFEKADALFEDYLCKKNDELDNATYQLILAITGKTAEELPWDMKIIGDVELAIESAMESNNIHLCHPYYSDFCESMFAEYRDEDENEVPCYRCGDCSVEKCPFMQILNDNGFKSIMKELTNS